MYSTSDAYKAALAANNRTWRLKIKMSLDGGEVLDLTDRDVMLGSFSYDESSICSGNLDVGATYANGLQFSLENSDKRFSKLKFAYAKITAYVGLLVGEDTWKDIPLGVFFVTEDSKKLSSIPINALDTMYRLNQSTSKIIILPNSTPHDILTSIATKFDFFIESETEKLLQTASLILPGFEDEKVSCRDFVGYCAALFGKSARFNREGKLEFYSVSDTVYETSSKNRTALTLSDILIQATGVRITDKDKNTYQMGGEDYVLEVAANPLLIDEEVAAQALSSTFASLTNIQYLPYTCSLIGDPSIQCGDRVRHLSKDGDTESIITGFRFKFRGESQIEAAGKTPESDRQLTQAAKKLVEVEQKAKQDLNLGLNNLEQLMLKQSELITSSMTGLYPYVKKDADGKPVAYYMMDDPDPDKAKTVWTFTENGIGVGHDGINGSLTDMAITADGNIIAQSVAAYLLTLEKINSADGSLSIDLQGGKYETKTPFGICTIQGNEVTMACQDEETKQPISKMTLAADTELDDESVNMKMILASNDNTVSSFIEQSFDYNPDTGKPTYSNPLLISSTSGVAIDKDLAVRDSILYDNIKMQRKYGEAGNTGVDFVLSPGLLAVPVRPKNLFRSKYNPGFESKAGGFEPWTLRSGAVGSTRVITTDKHSGSACLQQNYASAAYSYVRAPIKTPAKRFYIGCWMRASTSLLSSIVITPNEDGSSPRSILSSPLVPDRWTYKSAIVENDKENFIELKSGSTICWDDFFLCEAGDYTKAEIDTYVKGLYSGTPDYPDDPEHVENLLQASHNPGFELSDTSFAPWRIPGSALMPNVGVSTESSHSGGNSLCQQGTSTSVQLPIQCPAKDFYIGLWMRISTSSASAEIFLSGNKTLLQADASENNDRWCYYSALVKNTAVQDIFVLKRTTGTVYCDDFFLCEAGNYTKEQLDGYVKRYYAGNLKKPAPPRNLFPYKANGGFELSADSIAPWSVSVESTSGKWGISPETSRSGQNSLYQTGVRASKILAPIHTPAANFYLGFWTRKDSAVLNSRIIIGNGSDCILLDNFSTNGQWVYQSAIVENELEQEIFISADCDAPAYWDDFFLCKSDGYTKDEIDDYVMNRYTGEDSTLKNLFLAEHNPGFELNRDSYSPWTVVAGSESCVSVTQQIRHSGSSCLCATGSTPVNVRASIKAPATTIYIGGWMRKTAEDSCYGMAVLEADKDSLPTILFPKSQDLPVNKWVYGSALVENDKERSIELMMRADGKFYFDDFFMCEAWGYTKEELDNYVLNQYAEESDKPINLFLPEHNPSFEASENSLAPWVLRSGSANSAGLSNLYSHSGENCLLQSDSSTLRAPVKTPVNRFYIGCWVRKDYSSSSGNLVITPNADGSTPKVILSAPLVPNRWMFKSAIVENDTENFIELQSTSSVYWDDFFLCEAGDYTKQKLDAYAMSLYPGDPNDVPTNVENLFQSQHNPGFELSSSSAAPWVNAAGSSGSFYVSSTNPHSGSRCLIQYSSSCVQAPIKTPDKRFYISCWIRNCYNSSELVVSPNADASAAQTIFTFPTYTNAWIYQSAIVESSAQNFIFLKAPTGGYYDDFFLCEAGSYTKQQLDSYVKRQYPGDWIYPDDPENLENLFQTSHNPGFEQRTGSIAPWTLVSGESGNVGVSTFVRHSGSNSLYQKQGESTIRIPVQAPPEDFYIGCWMKANTSATVAEIYSSDNNLYICGNSGKTNDEWVYLSALIKNTVAREIQLKVSTDGIVFWDDFFLYRAKDFTKDQLNYYVQKQCPGDWKEPAQFENLFYPGSNPGFESSAGSYEPWSTMESFHTAEILVIEHSGLAHSGSNFLYTSGGVCALASPVQAPGVTFYIGCWIFTNGTIPEFSILMEDGSMFPLETTREVSDGWSYLSAVVDNYTAQLFGLVFTCDDAPFLDDFFLFEAIEYPKDILDDYVLNLPYEGGN